MTVIQAPSRNLATRTTRRVTPVAKAPKPLMSMRWRRPGESEERLSGGPVEAHSRFKATQPPFRALSRRQSPGAPYLPGFGRCGIPQTSPQAC